MRALTTSLVFVLVSGCQFSGEVGGDDYYPYDEDDDTSPIEILPDAFRVRDSDSCQITEPTACGVYSAAFRIHNTGGRGDVTRISQINFWFEHADDLFRSFADVDCAEAPWTLASGHNSGLVQVELNNLGNTEKSDPSLRFPCGDAEVLVPVDPPLWRPPSEGYVSISVVFEFADGDEFSAVSNGELQ